MDDDNSHNCTENVVEVSRKSEIRDNSTGDHTAVVDPDQLIGPQVIDMIMNKPEFSFLIRYYSLLYQSLIPNCKLTINTLRQHIRISDNIEQYIVGAASHRTRCQRLINFLLTRLHSERDYMQFCYHLNIISVMTDLPYRLIAEFHSNGNWGCSIPVHPRLSLHKSQPDDYHVSKHDLCATSTAGINIEAENLRTLSHVSQLDDHPSIQCCVDYDEASDDRAEKCSISDYYHHRKRSLPALYSTSTDKQSFEIQQETKKTDTDTEKIAGSIDDTTDLSFLLCSADWILVEEQFKSLCNVLPHNYKLTINKMKAIQGLLKDRGENLSKLILSSSTNVRQINKKIITYFIVKLCYNDSDTSLVRLCDVMDKSIDSTDTLIAGSISASCLHEMSSVTPVMKSCRIENSQHDISSQASISVPVVNETHTSSTALTTLSVECLAISSNVVTSISGQVISTITTTAAFAAQNTTKQEYELPQILHSNKDLTTLKSHYHTILHLMPDEYDLTVGKLQEHISVDQICIILNSSSSIIANKRILDYLIERVSCREGLLDLCDQLENISTSHDLKTVMTEIRLGIHQSIQLPISTAVTASTQSESLSNDQQHYSENATDVSKANLQEDLKYEDRRLRKGIKYLQPPPLPSNHVNRQTLLDEIVTKLLQATNDPNKYETTLTITGFGGFGKTTTVISLCHNPIINEHFTDGFIVIELGPKSTDPSVKLSQLHHLLTGEYLKPCDINHAEQEIKQLTREYFRKLLVIIDDVWHFEDAEPLVKAFSNCKTILTTRMKNIEQYIPSTQSVTIGPMTQTEAVSLLTIGVIDSSQLSQEDVNLLHEISQDVHLWPLLLSLIRGQLSHNLKQYRLPYPKAIQNVQAKLRHNGLKAFDMNNLGSRKLAVKVCIEVTLELLTKLISDKLKILVLYIGIGTSFPKDVLPCLWNISGQKASEAIDTLWDYGLVQFTDTTISPNIMQQDFVEVHAVISQYLIECMDSKEVDNFYADIIPNVNSINNGIRLTFCQSCGVLYPSTLPAMDFLKFKRDEIECVRFITALKAFNMFTVSDPHQVILILQEIKDALMTAPYLLPLVDEEINLLIDNCKQTLQDAHKICRKLIQTVQRNLHEKEYEKLIKSFEEFIIEYPLFDVAQKAINMVKKIITYCDGELLEFMIISCEKLQNKTRDHHPGTMVTLPIVKIDIKMHKRITSSLLSGSSDIELTYYYIRSGKYREEHQLLINNYLRRIA